MRRRLFLLPAALLTAVTATATAGILEDNLSAFTGDNAEGYLKPLQEAFGQGLNSNFFTTAAIPSTGFHARLEVKAMSIFFGDGDKTFMAVPDDNFGSQEAVEAPTVVGSGRGVIAPGPGGTTYAFPGGFDLTSLTIGVPQITLGGFRGTEFMGRWFSINSGDAEIGDISFLGLGVRHSISQYLPNAPLDVAGAVYYQTFDLGTDLLDAKTFSVGVQGSKGFGIITPYGGLALDTISMKVRYTADTGDSTEDIAIDFKSETSLHLTLGATLGLGLLHVNVAGDIAKMTEVSAGLGFGF
jgi:Family of unknown function (DUF6588)